MSSDPVIIQRKYAEVIADFVADFFIDSSGSIHPDTKKDLVDGISRILAPEFEKSYSPESSQILSYSYDSKSKVLQIIFQHGTCYWYHGVEETVFKKLNESESKGKFLNAAIKENYPYERVR